MIYKSFTNVLPIDYQWFTNLILLLLLSTVYQSFANQPNSFYYTAYIVAIVTNYSNLLQNVSLIITSLTQSFT